MKAREEKKLIITANPEELRALADKMERRWEKLRAGESTFVDFLDYEAGVHLHLDQVWFHAKDKAK